MLFFVPTSGPDNTWYMYHTKQHKLKELQKNVVCLLTSVGSKKTNWKNLQGNVVLGFNFKFRIIDGSQENNINWKN